MNMKKTLAGFMAGVVAISAMATVAVSAKAQKAENVKWSTVVEVNKESTVDVIIEVPAYSGATNKGKTIVLANANNSGFEKFGDVKKVSIIKGADPTKTAVYEKELAAAIVTKAADDVTLTIANTALVDDDAGNAGAKCDTIFITVEVKGTINTANNKVAANTITLANTGTAAGVVDAGAGAGTQVKHSEVEATKEDKGVLTNKQKVENGKNTVNWVDNNGGAIMYFDLDAGVSGWVNRNAEAVDEIADTLKDAKKAQIVFNFASADVDADKAGSFHDKYDRYDWGAMESAISLRVNNSNELSVAMAEFDKANFSAVFNWDDVMGKFQIGSVAGLIRSMQLKINNDKLPKKDGAAIDLRLASVEIKIPALEDTGDDSMVEDFAAGESATVVEATLPATTDAPAATDATTAATDGAANPETGNSAIALLAIPAALAAAAIVAKKRG